MIIREYKACCTYLEMLSLVRPDHARYSRVSSMTSIVMHVRMTPMYSDVEVPSGHRVKHGIDPMLDLRIHPFEHLAGLAVGIHGFCGLRQERTYHGYAIHDFGKPIRGGIASDGPFVAHMTAGIDEIIEQQDLTPGMRVLIEQIDDLPALEAQDHIGLLTYIGGECGGGMRACVDAVGLQQVDDHRIGGMRRIMQDACAPYRDAGVAKIVFPLNEPGPSVIFGHHGTALVAGAYIHDPHDDHPSLVRRAYLF